LRPDGVFVLMWNIPAGPIGPSTVAVDRFVDRALAERGLNEEVLGYSPSDLNTARVASGAWRHAFVDSPFTDFQEARLRHAQAIAREGRVASYAPRGWIPGPPDEERSPVLDGIRSRLPASRYRRLWDACVYWTHLPGP